MTTRPNSLPFWCTNNPSNMSPPSQAQVQTGWLAGQPPSAEVANQQANSVGNWIAYLDSRDNSTQLASSLDFSTRLVGGGAYSLVGTTLAWSAPFFVAVPSQPDANNTVAAGSITLPSGSVAYVTANMPFSTTAATTTGSKDLTGVLYGDQAAVGQLVTGAGIPSGTQVTSVSADGQTVSMSQAATASASGVTTTFSSSGTLTPQVAASATFVPGPNAVVFARGLDTTAIVGIGSGQMLLRQGESKQLLGHGYTASATYPAGVALGASVPVYISPGPATGDPGRTAGAAYPLDASANSNSIRSALAGFTVGAVAGGAPVEIVAAGRLGGFTGLVPGTVYYGGVGASTVQGTAPTAAGQYVVPVGMALTTSQLLIWNGSPAALTASTFSYRSVIDMGFVWLNGNNTAQTYYPTQDVAVLNGTVLATSHRHNHTHGGSIVGVSIHVLTAGPKVNVYLAPVIGQPIFEMPILGANQADNALAFPKGMYPFAAKSFLGAWLRMGEDNVNLVARVTVTVEYAP